MCLFRHKFVTGVATLFLCCLSVFTLALLSDERPAAATELPLIGLTVFLDAGHGGYDGGSRAKDSGVWEKEINLAVALKTKTCLETKGAKVIMSRETDMDLCDAAVKSTSKKRQDLQRRLEMAVNGQADILLSIHMNEYRSRTESGPHVFYRKNQEASRLLAGCMQQALIDGTRPQKERVAQAGDYFMLSLERPSVLIECGFISNAAEEKKLLSPDYQALLADAIVQGLIRYRSLQSVL